MPSLDNLNHGSMPSTSFQSAILSANPFGHISSSGNSSKREGDHETFEQREERRKKRKSRWASEDSEKTQIPGMPTVIPTNLTKEQEEAYVLQLQIEEISRKLRTGDLGIPANPEERSPSPEPIYGFDGKRMNTREYRTRKKLEEERHQLICRMFKTNPDFKPPADYKPPLTRVSDKVMIPQDIYPDINFVGLLIGPRGNTLKSMEHETGAKIIIRGKGSVKEGKVGRKDGQPLPGENEPLHAYVTANNPEFVKKAVEKIKEIIRQGVEVPEGQNDLRRQQLRELALLNGTLRENEGMRCTNCGASDHKSWTCPDKPNVTMQVICTTCGGAGHIAKDCRQKRPGMGYPPTVYPGIGIGSASHHQQQQNPMDKAKIDEEYMSLMAELGEGPPPNRDNSRGGNYDRNRGSSSSGGLFDRPSAPRAVAAPGPGPAHTSMQHIPNNLPPPPWSQHSSKLPTPNSSSPPNQPPSSSSTPNMMHGSGWQGPPGCPPYQYYPNGPPNNQQWMGSANDTRPPSSWSYGGGNNSDSRSAMNNSWAPPYNGGIPSNIHGLLTAPPPPPPPPPSSS